MPRRPHSAAMVAEEEVLEEFVVGIGAPGHERWRSCRRLRPAHGSGEADVEGAEIGELELLSDGAAAVLALKGGE